MSVDELDQEDHEGTRYRIMRAFTVWYAVLGGIAAWTVHLVAEASLVQWTCDSHRGEWVLNAITAVCVLACLLAIALSWRLWREGRGADDESDEPRGRTQFLGFLGLATGIINLALIGVEGVYVPILYHCG
jgi:hypothetical protein